MCHTNVAGPRAPCAPGAQARLHYILGFVGGLMAAVSVLELWPEARKCRHDQRMYLGIALGMALMGATLFYV